MKLLIYADPHWCETSSIVRSYGEKYTTRLEYLTRSQQYVETYATINKVDKVICLGDFFDGPNISAMTLSALRLVNWSDCEHIYLCGNHEMASNDLTFNSANIFDLCSNSRVISTPEEIVVREDNTKLFFLPYILEADRKEVGEYFNITNDGFRHICFSHNDLKGIQLGPIISRVGFDINDIENSFDCLFNGHLHNGLQVSKNIINVGNLCGQNFSEDAFNYNHKFVIVDITKDNMTFDFIENPYALNFYKLDLTNSSNYGIIDTLKENAVVSITTTHTNYDDVKKLITDSNKIIESRIICQVTIEDITGDHTEELSQVDHLQEFQKYVLETVGTNEVIQEELTNIIGG